MSSPRIKICGLTRSQDVAAVVAGGADAVGLVFYPPSPRYVGMEQAAALVHEVPPFVTRVGLFVNAEPRFVRAVLAAVPLDVLQFHGDESEAHCCQFERPYIKAARVQPGLDLLEYASRFPTARGLLLDSFVEGYGGGGKPFDWSLIPQALPLPLILSGGLNAANVGEAIRTVCPVAVDVSSGVEVEKGIKDVSKIEAFVAAVRNTHV